MGAKFIKVSVIYLVIGILLGIYMGASEQFQFAHAHAHINLLGWVTLALSGLIYKAYPNIAGGKLAGVHFWGFMIGIPLLTTGMVLFALDMFGTGVPITMVGSLFIVIGLISFAINMFVKLKDN